MQVIIGADGPQTGLFEDAALVGPSRGFILPIVYFKFDIPWGKDALGVRKRYCDASYDFCLRPVLNHLSLRARLLEVVAYFPATVGHDVLSSLIRVSTNVK
jgi:hypothetical protein